MKVYVFTRAYAPEDGYLDIYETKVFLSLDEAQAYMEKEIDSCIHDPEDGDLWSIVYRTDFYCQMSYNRGREQSTCCIEIHDI